MLHWEPGQKYRGNQDKMLHWEPGQNTRGTRKNTG